MKKGSKKKSQAYGPHLILDCYRASTDKLADLALMFHFLTQLPKLIGMEKIGPPLVAEFQDLEEAGVTGVVLIVTSHISVHTYPYRRCCFVDVFSCRPFSRQLVERYVRNTFEVSRMKSKWIMRGEHFPKHNHFSIPKKEGQP